MYSHLQNDLEHFPQLLSQVQSLAEAYWTIIRELPAAVNPPTYERPILPKEGWGATTVLNLFEQTIAPYLAASSGPRYLGFVTGGVTPAALLGDWLATLFDQNVIADSDSIAPQIEEATIAMLRDLFSLPSDYQGVFVSGATMSSFAALATGRQWCARQIRYDVAQLGLYGLPPIRLLGAAPHASIYKSMSMLGLGRKNLIKINSLPGREAIDIDHLRFELAAARAELIPVIVVGSAGTVNTVDFDDLAAIGGLKEEFTFWYHVDAAFGGFAACCAETAHLVDGLDTADSITIDAHKWLNVPYDSAMMFTRHPAMQLEVMQNAAAYLGDTDEESDRSPPFVHRSPQNSRRFRALAAWFSLLAYGADGYGEIVGRCCRLARDVGERIKDSNLYELLAPVRLNVVCFAPTSDAVSPAEIASALRNDGRVFVTPTVLDGRPALRMALANWRTIDEDIDLVWRALLDAAKGWQA